VKGRGQGEDNKGRHVGLQERMKTESRKAGDQQDRVQQGARTVD
jgi:hypothetical protein